MTWDEVIKIAITVITGFGGVFVVAGAIIKFSADKIAERLSAKYELRLNKELESYKSQLDNKNYVSKVRFDLEFSIYGEISEILLSSVEACFWLFPYQLDRVPADKDEAKAIYQNRYKEAIDKMVLLQRTLGSKAPFISKELYKDFDELKKLLSRQVNMYTWCGDLAPKQEVYVKAKSEAQIEAYNRTEEILKKHEEVVDKMRNYFDTLIVEEG